MEGLNDGVVEELDDGALDFIAVPDDVGHTLGTVLLGELDEVVEELAGFARHLGSADRFDHAAVGDSTGERLEVAIAEKVAHIDHFQRVAEVGLIRAETFHGFAERNARERGLGVFFGGELAEDIVKESFDHSEDLVLIDKTHFHVHLIEFAGTAVCTGILVAEAGGDLEVTVKTGDHQQLFELLGSLRQSVELARMQTGGNQIVTGTFGAAGSQNGGLEFVETVFGHVTAHFSDDLAAEHDVVVKLFAAQVEEAVFQTHGFGGLIVFGDLEWDHIGLTENFHCSCIDFNFAGGEFGVDRAFFAGNDFTVELDDSFDTPMVQFLIEGTFGVDDHLSDAVMVAEVDENDAAMVTDAMDPAGETDFFSHIGFAEFTASVSTILTHFYILFYDWYTHSTS